jgi:hypothetical protein
MVHFDIKTIHKVYVCDFCTTLIPHLWLVYMICRMYTICIQVVWYGPCKQRVSTPHLPRAKILRALPGFETRDFTVRYLCPERIRAT